MEPFSRALIEKSGYIRTYIWMHMGIFWLSVGVFHLDMDTPKLCSLSPPDIIVETNKMFWGHICT